MKKRQNSSSAKQKKRRLIRIRVTYLDKGLQRLTRKKEEIISIPEGTRSGDFLDFLQERYPAIFEKFGPGYLGFTLNEEKPHVLTLLKEGDQYKFITWTDEEIFQSEIQRFKESGAIVELPKGEFKMPKWMECTWRRIPCGRDGCPICGRIKRDRQRHLECGEDPDDLKNVFEDVGNSFKEDLELIKKDAERLGIDITNIDNIQEPPEPKKFPLYRKVSKWRNFVEEILNDAYDTGSLWIETEAAADLLWYKNILMAKTYRQLCNQWHLKNGDEYGEVDYEYTKYILDECLKILKKVLNELILLESPQKLGLIVALARLSKIEEKILSI